jgi:hypothetical protein
MFGIPLMLLSSLLLCPGPTCEGLSQQTPKTREKKRSDDYIQPSGFAFSDGRTLMPNRRTMLSNVLSLPFVWVASSLPAYSSNGAAAPLDAGEAIRRSAASIPGYGQTDVFYPESFAGTWKVTRDVEFNGSNETLRLQYPVRFIQSIENGAVVADRGYNQAELQQAIATAVKGGDLAAGGTIRSYEWIPSNPNDLRIVLFDGTKKEMKVTKRATERTNDTVSSSEFQRVTQEDQQRGIPVISARRVVSKWRKVDNSTLEAIEIVYDMGGGDPLAGATAQSGTMLSKSKLLLVR